ncbi:hypothetical protein V1509DRAFT_633525 [Lipomyces kononenkoae]
MFPLNPGGKKAKAADPQFFHGDRKKLREFFAQLSIKFATNPELFPDEQSKVGYAASYLPGHAFSLYASMMPDGVMPSARDRPPIGLSSSQSEGPCTCIL